MTPSHPRIARLPAEARAGGATPDAAAEKSAIGLVEAMSIARRSVAHFTEQKVDAVPACTKGEAGWEVLVDVVESPARLGDNDLLSQYRVSVSPSGEVTGFARARRYHREDKEESR